MPPTAASPSPGNAAQDAGEHLAHPALSRSLVILMAMACGVVVANIYYAQPLVALIGPAVGLSPEAASLVVTLTQIGYGVGLILLVPLGDLLENRRLVVVTLCSTVAALLVAAVAPTASLFLAAAFLIGVTSVAVQMLVPLAAHMAPEASRGRVVGNVMSGLLLGILLARPVSSLIADSLGWRAVFALSAVVMVGFAVLLARVLPQRRPRAGSGYGALIGSLGRLLVRTPVLQRRTAYQTMVFASFSLYWTAVPLLLAGAPFHLTQRGIALFALSGAAGALVAPIAGRIADRGWTRPATGVALAMAALSFFVARAGEGSIALLVLAGLLLDMGVQMNMVLGQRAIYSLGAETRSRMNAIYMAIFFLGGAAGSALAGYAFATGGWEPVTWIGFAFPALGLLFYLTEFLGRRTA
ncbi:MFS transporter [Azospirillum picis]|uniref:MFS family arabinose efflux permease n=1 Tax=Azospirillum picis TaxID=488438 RepID=A0ABU0MCV9_9PROT|nr:MFS transporter [Azospirillum picis]MBP2297764.1 putative MFS family arabinose efflux permease [Azospirillum picis]MDQ0531213.1 putative MFS family arabinose efflux permease [Azospirillum picis]